MSIEQRLAACLAYFVKLENEWVDQADLPASQAQIQFIMWLGQHPNCRLQHIASGLGLTAPTVSVGVRRMEQMGLVQRGSDSSDQRAISLMLSPTGEQLYELALAARANQVKKLLDQLRPNEQRQLVNLMERMFGLHEAEEETPRQVEPTPKNEPPREQPSAEPGATQLALFGSTSDKTKP
ncbi:MAG: MarR family winged helix-turn-helix transcriptional regulator [Anaerolineae bacterium]